jgi:hypothetical protein
VEVHRRVETVETAVGVQVQREVSPLGTADCEAAADGSCSGPVPGRQRDPQPDFAVGDLDLADQLLAGAGKPLGQVDAGQVLDHGHGRGQHLGDVRGQLGRARPAAGPVGDDRGLAGALIAGIGVAIVFADQMRLISPLTLAAILAGAAAAAQSTIIVKSFTKVDPVVENGIGMAVGSMLLFVVSLIAGESWILPTTLEVQLSLGYLILIGSIGLFLLFLFILGRWTASATIYVLLLAPLTAVALDLFIFGDMPTLPLIVGGVVAIAGVYVGALYRPSATPAGPTGRDEDPVARS